MAENLGLLFDKDTNDKVSRLDTDYTTGLATTLSTNVDATISSRSTLVQADILSDATPFAGANIDAAISSRSTLTQAQILSDATPFAGANIDAAISTRSTLTQAQIISDTTPFLGADIPAIRTAVDTTIPGDITAAVTSIKGAGPRDITEVYNLVNTSSNPFRLTTYGIVTGSPVSYVNTTWVDIYSSGALSKDVELTGIVITNSGGLTGDAFRITLGNGTTKIFPYDVSNPIGSKSGKLEEFQFPVRIPSDQTYKIQVYCTAASARTATLTELDVIEHG